MKHMIHVKYIDILSKVILIFSSLNYLFFALYNINYIDILFTPNSKLIYVIIGAFGIYQLYKLIKPYQRHEHHEHRMCHKCHKCHKCRKMVPHSENTLIYTPPRFLIDN